MKSFLLYNTACLLGEGPMWHAHRQSCFWVDIEARSLFEYSLPDNNLKQWIFHKRVSAVLRHEDNNLVVALQGALGKFNPDTGALQEFLALEPGKPNNRCNDGACDSQGRLWIGTMDRQCKKGAGALYCVDKDQPPEIKLTGLSIPNGLAWSRDNRRFFFIDSPNYRVQAYAFEETSGQLTYENDVIVIPETLGMPDGMAIDQEGMLWIAHWGGHGVYQWDPDTGALLGKIEVPTPHVTSCAFYGPELNRLLITTARDGLSPAELQAYPESGHIFFALPGVRGMPTPACRIPST